MGNLIKIESPWRSSWCHCMGPSSPTMTLPQSVHSFIHSARQIELPGSRYLYYDLGTQRTTIEPFCPLGPHSPLGNISFSEKHLRGRRGGGTARGPDALRLSHSPVTPLSVIAALLFLFGIKLLIRLLISLFISKIITKESSFIFLIKSLKCVLWPPLPYFS